MPRRNPEHDASLLLRLPSGLKTAIAWTAQYDRLSVAEWIRQTINARCFSVTQWGALEQTLHSSERTYDVVDKRTLRSGAARKGMQAIWRGGRNRDSHRRYHDLDGEERARADIDPDEAFQQDIVMNRAQARQEIRAWLTRWRTAGRRAGCLDEKQERLAQRLLATFDGELE